jgi:hypothetical protein
MTTPRNEVPGFVVPPVDAENVSFSVRSDWMVDGAALCSTEPVVF